MTKSITVDVDYLEVDASSILAQIQNESFTTKWQIKDFQTLCRSPGVITQIASVGTLNEKKPIAFGLYRVAATEAEILSLAVIAAFRSKGIALEMLEDIFSRFSALKIEQVFLEVAADNDPAISLYTKAGFIRSGLRRNYYRQKEGDKDALIMSKYLTLKQADRI